MKNAKEKCSCKNHVEIDAIIYCQECRIYMCNKCEKLHSELLQNHHSINLDKNIKDLFTGYCKEQNHTMKLNYFCINHNQLCCAACLCKIKGEGKDGLHKDCKACLIEEIKIEKKK